MKQVFKHIAFLFLVSGSAMAQMKPFALKEVRLTESIFKNAQEVDLKYILALKPDRLLAPYLIDAGLKTKDDQYGNWENIGLDGHIGGHYLSALAMMYASTGNAEMKKRLDYMVSELARCQAKNGNGYVGGIPQGKIFWERIQKGDIDGSGFGLNNTWVPLYNIHKLFAGLRDAYQFGGNQEAKKILIGLGDWFIALVVPLSDVQIQTVLRTEHGGINEVFADLYEITQDEKYLEMAQKISHKALLEPLIAKEDKLTGLHANTQIPKVIGYEKISTFTHNQDWANAAQYFWKNVTQTRSVAFGGNSVREHFNSINDFSSMLKSNQGPETCNSFNMLRLSKALFLDNNDISYLDFYEKTMYNHILSSQHPEKGGFVYFTPIRPNHYRVYSQPETSMWCCVGSGLENHTKYGELIYSHTANDVFVNFFIPSVLNWKLKGISLTQKTAFPYKNGGELILKLKKNKQFALNLRYPTWADDFKVLINGKVQKIETGPNAYISLNRIWKNADKVTFSFSTKTKMEYLPDGSNWAAYVNGPIVLAAKTSDQNLDGLFADDSRMGHETKGKLMPINSAYALVGEKGGFINRLKPSKNLHFCLDSLQLQPFFEIHDSRYQMYFQVFSEQEHEAFLAKQNKEETEYLALEQKTIDKINCGEQQPEVDHDFKGEKTFSGNEEGKFWRSTRSFMQYNLNNKNLENGYLMLTVIDGFQKEDLEISINGSVATNVKVENSNIRVAVENEKLLNIKISAKNGKPSPKLHQIRWVRN